jgi:hypothetical protein
MQFSVEFADPLPELQVLRSDSPHSVPKSRVVVSNVRKKALGSRGVLGFLSRRLTQDSQRRSYLFAPASFSPWRGGL